MAHIKTIIVSGGTALVVAILVGLTFGGSETVREIVRERSLGAAAGPDIISPYLRWGGVATYRAAEAMNTATNTVCALRSPASTSTLESFVAYLEVSSSTASRINFATSGSGDAQPSATTTLIDSQNIAANAKAIFKNASSTIISPNTWLVLGMQGGTGTFSPTGVCQATWQAI